MWRTVVIRGSNCRVIVVRHISNVIMMIETQ